MHGSSGGNARPAAKDNPIVIVGVEDGQPTEILDCNVNVTQLLNFPVDDLVGRPVQSLVAGPYGRVTRVRACLSRHPTDPALHAAARCLRSRWRRWRATARLRWTAVVAWASAR
jgi:hypothetical protein